MKEVIATGRSVEEAIANGCAELGVDSGDAQFEIIEMNKKTLFGLRSVPAKVRVYIDEPEEKKPAPRKSERPARKPERTPERAPEKKAEKKEKPQQPKPQQPKKEAAPAAEPAPKAPKQAGNVQEKVEVALQYVRDVLAAMELGDATVTSELEGETLHIRLEGEGLGVIIGRRGETLDALQYLTGLAINRVNGDYLRITIDSSNYREKREKTLEALATKLAKNAVRTGKRTMLEPMNPYERRIIHAAVSKVEGATSASTGEEPNRRVVISSTEARPYTPKEGGERYGRGGRGGRDGGRGGRGGRNDRGRGGRGDRERTRAPRVEEPELPPEEAKRIEEAFLRSQSASEANSKPLYSKIDLGSEE